MMATVLFVDDEPAIREMLRRVLKLAGHTALEASSAAQARDLLAEHTADLALVDIMMPGENGFSLGRSGARPAHGCRGLYPEAL